MSTATTVPLGRPFSREYIDAEQLDPILTHLIPWAKRDIRDTLEDEVPKAEKSLKRIEQELKDSRVKLAKQTAGSPDHARVSAEVDFLTSMHEANRARLEFYAGKVYLLRKRLSLSQ